PLSGPFPRFSSLPFSPRQTRPSCRRQSISTISATFLVGLWPNGEWAMGRIWLGLLILIALAGAALYAFRDQIAVAIFKDAVEHGVSADAIDPLPDGLSAGFCGTGSPLPDRTRAGPCTAIVAGKRLFIFDAGDGSAETLALMGLSPARIEAV